MLWPVGPGISCAAKNSCFCPCPFYGFVGKLDAIASHSPCSCLCWYFMKKWEGGMGTFKLRTTDQPLQRKYDKILMDRYEKGKNWLLTQVYSRYANKFY